jgi:hypothetical protein
VRELDQQYPIGQRCRPLVRTVRFDVNHERGLVPQHSIRGTGGFAYGIVETSSNWGRPLLAPPPVSDCPTRYRRPTTDEGVAAAAPSQPIYTGGGLVARIATTNRRGLRSAYATGQGASQKKYGAQTVTWATAPERERNATATFDRSFAMIGEAR